MDDKSGVIKRILNKLIRSRIYLPDNVPSIAGAYGGCHYEVVTVNTADKFVLSGLRSQRLKPARYTLLYFHGNGGCAATRAGLLSALIEDGADIIVADYRGYGKNPGHPTEAGLTLDADAFYNYAVKTTSLPLVLFGHSLGGAVASALAAKNPDGLQGLVTLGTFASLELRAPSYIGALLPDRFDTMSCAAAISIPWVISHQKADEVTNAAHANILYEVSGKPNHVRLWVSEGGSHAIDTGNLSLSINWVLDFQDSVAKK